MSFYDFNALSLQGKPVNFADFKGKLLLVVNTASKCGFTPQYEGLEKLHRAYADKGLTILGFPCNQFGNQEPGDPAKSSCLINYGVSFPMFAKLDVKGPDAHPLFQWLSEKCPGLFGKTIKWNFTKFLVSQDGTPLKRFAPLTKPEQIEAHIQKALAV